MTTDAELSDLELCRLCAEAMGYKVIGPYYADATELVVAERPESFSPFIFNYAPLKRDAQAMALVKRFRLVVEPFVHMEIPPHALWNVRVPRSLNEPLIAGVDADLNRAICLCVARMQEAKRKEG